MSAPHSLTAERVREILSYNQTTGQFVWLQDRRTGRGKGRLQISAGTVAGGKDGRYQSIGIDGKTYWAHRLAFLMVTDAWPTKHVDHIDGNPMNNAWGNLRDVSRSVNMQNRYAAPSTSTHGFLGVTKNHKRFLAQIRFDSKYRYLGTYDTPQEAHEAYLSAKRQFHEGNML